MVKTSAGILIYKEINGKIKVFLVHPGGPFWKGKDENAWDFPKGEVDEGEEIFNAALRELKEETGIDFFHKNKEDFFSLGKIVRKDGKIINIFTIEGDWSGILMGSAYVEIVDSKTNKKIRFPEIDKAGFFYIEEARKKVFLSLNEFLDRLEDYLENQR